MTETDFDAKMSSLNRKITSNKSKHLLYLLTFTGKSYIEEDGR